MAKTAKAASGPRHHRKKAKSCPSGLASCGFVLVLVLGLFAAFDIEWEEVDLAGGHLSIQPKWRSTLSEVAVNRTRTLAMAMWLDQHLRVNYFSIAALERCLC